MLVLSEDIGGIRRLTLNRPEKLNALNAELTKALEHGIADAANSSSTRVIVIRGEGPCFSSGGDLTDIGSFSQSSVDDAVALRSENRWYEELFDCPIPVIAQVHGWCLAMATDLAFNCDIVLAANSAKIGHPAVRNLGTPPNNMWIYHGGPQLAKRLLLTGDTISGEEAAERGLVFAAYPDEDLDAQVLALAHRVAQVSREMLIVNKAVLNMGLELMGRSSLRRYAIAQDALAHCAPSAIQFRNEARDRGLNAALADRDAGFAR